MVAAHAFMVPGGASLRMLSDWNKDIGVALEDAFRVSMDVMGRTGEEACKHALILMAESAGAMTPKAPTSRPVQKDRFGEYIENWRQGDNTPQRLYKWMFGMGGKNNRKGIGGEWANAKKIGNRGLGARSWMWGLGKLGAHVESREISGTSRVYSIHHDKVNGYIKENALSYIVAIMPGGWEAGVETRAGNKIMGQYRDKMEKQWRQEMKMPRRDRKAPAAEGAFLARYFTT